MNTQSATKVDPRFGSNAEPAMSGHAGGVTHAIGDVLLTAGRVAGGTVAKGQILQINQNQSLFNLLGNKYGGDGTTTFALPDLREGSRLAAATHAVRLFFASRPWLTLRLAPFVA